VRSSTPAPAAFERLCRQAEARRRALGIPGAALGIRLGRRLLLRGFGTLRAGGREDVAPDTLFQVGSITKTFVATLLLRLRRRSMSMKSWRMA
jgi:CubicO group peptidase (beta-lactamase class C family)